MYKKDFIHTQAAAVEKQRKMLIEQKEHLK